MLGHDRGLLLGTHIHRLERFGAWGLGEKRPALVTLSETFS